MAVIATIIITILANKSNDKDTADAIAAMRNIAVAMDKDRPILASQADAAQAAARFANEAVDASKRQADAASSTASANIRGVNQSAKFFAAQQRPVLIFDENSTHYGPPAEMPDGTWMWNYTYKNIGLSPAYDVITFPMVSIYGLPFQGRKTFGPREMASNESKWGTAQFLGARDNPKRNESLYARLFVRIQYKDTLGNVYWSGPCIQLSSNGSVINCSPDYDPKSGKRVTLR
ncbi:hypothetical protein [Sphingomonas sp. BK069]|uniref:hypothetical protein n=1 Tax=Sphingomonas sp. BK069 TaxID=2586979 RepID=UPI0016152D64|nr:hypothetical protein [Sphingomonas sp. BK069]MBB3346040.1 hypothetical protein [Sphingomonas sp. BK069]